MPFNTQSSPRGQNTSRVPTQAATHRSRAANTLQFTSGISPLANRVQKSNQIPASTSPNLIICSGSSVGAHDGSLSQLKDQGPAPLLNFLIMRILMKEMLIGARWPPRTPPNRVCLILETQTHDGSFETQTWLDILNFKPVVGMAPPVQPCSSLSLSAGFDSVHG